MEGFVRMSKYAGMREDIVQAGGGNSSVKLSGERMAIKSSGVQLSDITKTAGYALVNPKAVRESFARIKDIDTLTAEDGKAFLKAAFIEGSRPSIETFLHAASGTYTLHTHPIVVNALCCRKGGVRILRELFPEALFVPYATPGIELAKACFKAYGEKREKLVDIVFLENHGVVVSGKTGDEVIEKTEKLLLTIEKYLKADFSGYHLATKIWHLFEDKIVWRVTDINILKEYRRLGKIWPHAFCPDCVVFLGKKLLELPEGFTKDDARRFMEKYGQPVMAACQGNLYIMADSVKKALEIQSVMSFSAQVTKLNAGFEANLLSEAEQNFLLNWEDEKYRKGVK